MGVSSRVWSALQIGFAFAMATVLTLLLYWHGWVSLPRSDQLLAFMPDRELFANPADFLKSALLWNRNRVHMPGDAFLFRPGTHGLLAVFDIWFRTHLYIQGLLSLVVHSATATLFWLQMRKRLGFFPSAVMTAVFLAQYSGIEMIAWRHITGYQIGFFFLAAGFALIGSPWAETTRARKAAVLVCFLLSILFHEIGLLVIPAAILLDRFWNSKPFLSFWLGAPLLIYGLMLLWNVLSPVPGIGGASFASHSLTDAMEALTVGPLSYLGAMSVAAFAPFSIHFQGSELGRLEWPYSVWVLLVPGILTIMGLVRLLPNAKTLQRRAPLDPWILFCIGVVLANFLGVGLLRRWISGHFYMRLTTYYFYFSNLALLGLAGVWLSRLKAKPVRILILAFFAATSILSAIRILSVFGETRALTHAVAHMGLKARTYFAEHPERCLLLTDNAPPAATDSPDIVRSWPGLDRFFYDYDCRHRGGEPVALEELRAATF